MSRHHTIGRDLRNGNYFVRILRSGISKYFNLGDNKREAQAKLKKLELKIEAGAIPFVRGETSVTTNEHGIKDCRLEELCVKYLAWAKQHLAESTYKTRDHYLSTFCRFVGKRMVSEIDKLILSNYHAHAREHLGRSENGGNTHLRHVKTLLKWGDEMGLCACPVRHFPKIREMPPKTNYFTEEEMDKLLKRVPKDFHDMLFFGVLTGTRPQELRPLKKENLKLNKGFLSVVIEHHKTSDSAKVPKPRVVGLCTTAAEIVKRQLAAHPESDYIFLNDDGEPYTAGTLRQRLERWCRRAGIQKRPPYALRHFYGTVAAGHGCNQDVLSQMMGHTTSRTTSRYIHAVPEYQQRAMDEHEKNILAMFPSDTVQDVSGDNKGVSSSQHRRVGG